MTYPSSIPVNKHDLISAAEVSLSRMSPTLDPHKLAQQATQTVSAPPDSKSYPKRLATIYTYDNAPSSPRPMCASLPIQGFCSLESIGLSSSSFVEPSKPGMITCRFAVKRADGEYKRTLQLKEKDIINSKNFSILCQQLRRNQSAAFFICPKTERAGFIVALDDTFDACDYAAYCLVANVCELEQILNSNNDDNGNGDANNNNNHVQDETETVTNQEQSELWKPPTVDDDDNNTFDATNLWQPSTPEHESNDFFTPTVGVGHMNGDADACTNNDNQDNDDGTFHADSGAAAADTFYSNLTRSLDTRADSFLFHMRNFNGWVKATQISELDPLTFDSSNPSKKRKRTKHPLRILDLACGKGGDLGKWVLHKRGIANYVGIDVARGSLVDAALRARKMRQLDKCVFTCADLGDDVPGRVKSTKSTKMQKLSSWSLKNDDPSEDPRFELVRGGGIAETDKFDVVSIQFAIHYMMSDIKRARRFFHSVSQLLEVGGNLIATTVDARRVMEHMMSTGYDFHFDDDQQCEENKDEHLTVAVGKGACQLKFHRDLVKKIFQRRESQNSGELHPDHFGLEYTFTLVEGQDHAAGVGQAVNLPEWLTPLPVLTSLAEEAGLVLDYACNFHEFFALRKDPMANHIVHGALYNMNVLNRSGTISEQEWEISGMYMAVKFRKERESSIIIDDDECNAEVEEDDVEMEVDSIEQPKQQTKIDMNDPAVKGKYILAMTTAKKLCGNEWQNMSGDERNSKTNEVLAKLLSK